MAVLFSQLQAQPTPLVGRTVELEAIEQRLTGEQVRLLSLIGPAGVGKTRLALEAGSRLADRFPDGVTFVNLAPVREPDLALSAIARTLGLVDTGPRPQLDRLQAHLHDRDTLLILDNFEQVLTAGGALAELLAAAPGLRILVTSRIPLRLRWERTLRIPPLPVPDLDGMLPLDALLKLPSIALFVDRAQAQRPDFIPTERQAPVLVQLTRQLDGLPLAIELAAAQMSVLPLAVIAHQLDHLLQTLQWDAQDLPERQRSLNAAIGWSCELLSEQERRLFRHLGVFVGRVSLDAIEAVVGGEDDNQTVAGMVSLAEKSLVLPGKSEYDDPEPSFRTLETVRQVAREQLDTQGELDRTSRAHAQYFLELAEQADPQLRRRGQLGWYFRLESEHDNLRAALRWLLDRGSSEPGTPPTAAGLGDRENALRLAGALGYFWWLRGYHREGWRWLEEALSKAPDAHPAVRTRALARAGTLLMYGGDLERSKAVLEEALDLARRDSNRSAIAQSLGHLGLCAALAGELAQSRHLLQEALRHAQELQDDHQISFTLAALGYRSLVCGDYQEAAALYSDSVSRFQDVGNLASATVVQFSLAVALRQLGETERAVELLQEGLRTSLAFKNRWHLSVGLEVTVSLVGDRTDAERRARLLGAVDTLVQATGAKFGTLARVTGQNDASLPEQLEHERLEAARRAGRSLPFSEVITLALAVLQDFSQTLTGSKIVANAPNQDSRVSPREQEVPRLVAEGLTSKQIGQQLFLSPRTVDHHLYSVFNKLGVESRAQAVAVATRDGFLLPE